jgi:hypothetical protein
VPLSETSNLTSATSASSLTTTAASLITPLSVSFTAFDNKFNKARRSMAGSPMGLFPENNLTLKLNSSIFSFAFGSIIDLQVSRISCKSKGTLSISITSFKGMPASVFFKLKKETTALYSADKPLFFFG